MSNRNPTDMGGAFAGVPICSRRLCPSYDGKRCRETGNEPESVCVPEVRAMAGELRLLHAIEHAKDSEVRGQSGRDNPDHANAAGGGHVRSGASPATGNVAEPQTGTEGSSALVARALRASDADLDDLARRADVLRNETTKLRRLLHRALLMAEDERFIARVADEIRKEAGL